MKKIYLKLLVTLRDTSLEFLIVFLILYTSIFNVIDIVPNLYQIDVKAVKTNIEKLINLLNNLLIPDCYALDFQPPDKAVFESLKGGNLSQSFQADLFTGKASFTYPIDVPPGRKGIQPNLNLIYSSQSNNDWCGVGWTLDLGSIYRSTKRGIPKYDNSDTFIFSINGSESELVNIGSNEYRTKIESEFMRFYFNGVYWEITDKTGIKYRLGYNSDSKVTNAKGSYKWCLDRVIDVFGNYMIISYAQDQGQIYLSQIRYTGNEILGDSLHCAVDFISESRQDIPPNYRTGDRVVNAYRLKEIQTKVDGVLAKKYLFNYAYSNDSKRSLLTSITQYGSDSTTSLPPTTFSYKENGYTITPGSSWISGFGNGKVVVSGDPNGDGLTDALITDPSGGYPNWPETRYWKIAVAQNGAFIPQGSFDFSVSSPIPREREIYYPIIGDFNGDGISDIGSLFDEYYPDPNQGIPMFDIAVMIAFSDSSRFIDKGSWLILQDEDFPISLSPSTGDFNGDGLSDILLTFLNGRINAYLSDGTKFNNFFTWDTGLMRISDYVTTLTGDFNGDGLSDIGLLDHRNGNWTVRISNGTAFESPQIWISNFGAGKTPLPIDFNGDGLTDAGVFDKDTGRWQVAISDGTKFIPSNDWINNFGAGKLPLAGDFAGKTITGPGYFDQGSGNWQIADVQGIPNDLLSEINNGIGGKTSITYAPPTPTTSCPFILPVVSSVNISDGLGNSYTTNYQFQGTLYDREDREFRGFNYVKVTDAEGNYTETYFHQDDIYKGRPYLQQTKDASGNLFTKQESLWNHTETNPGVYFVYLKQQDNYIYDGDTTLKQTRTDYEYDAYGNTKRIYSYGDVGVTGDEKDVYLDYAYNTTNWILSLLSHSYILDSIGNKSQEKWFYYDNHINVTEPPTKGLLTKEELWLNTGPQNPIITHTYDDYGNPKSTTDTEGHTTSITYENTYHIYPEILTNALVQNTRYTYDPKTGQILTTTDFNNQTSTNVYDVLGRLIRVIGPNDNIDLPLTIYEYDLSSCPIKVTKKSKVNTQGDYLTAYLFYDGLGRLMQTKSPAEDDPVTHLARQIVSEIVKYDQRGQVKEKYLPYFVQESPNYSTPDYSGPKVVFSYDAIGRPTQVTNPDTTYLTINYSDWVITKTDENSHYKTEYYDAYERLIKVEEHNQSQTYTTTYEYDIQDNLTKVIDNQNNVTQIWYDSLGRKIKMDDPDMGVWLYEYDKVGNLTKQTDAKGNIINFQYDVLNRLRIKDYPTETDVTYIYDETSKPNCIGRLSKVIDASGSTEFFYDNLGREIKSIKIVDGTSFTVERTYDSLNRVTSLKYPNGEIANYIYNKSGNIETISGASNYVTNVNYNATGQIIRIDYGNGTYTDYTYNPQTLRLSNLLTNDGLLQNLSYTFDNVGNIKGIVDKVNTATQSFIYDDLNRLTDASGYYDPMHYRYDSIGNMVEKEGVSYAYEQTGKKPHAVTWGSNGFSATYDGNGNMISKNNTVLTYDYDNRLTKVEAGTLTNEIELSIDLRPGWNFISLPVIPANTNITSVFSNLTFGTDYDQVSRYNAQTTEFEHFVNNPTFDDFTTIEYGKGYQIYITNPLGCTLIVKGYLPQQEENIGLLSGWNLVFSPYLTEKPVIDTLSPLAFGNDYDQVSRYNNFLQEFEHFRNRPDDTLHSMKPTEGYYLYCLKNTTWNIASQKSITIFVYDANGERVKKIANSETTIYIDSLYEKTSTKSTNHIFLGSNRIASIESTGNTYYYHQDHLGSSNIVTDQAGNRVQLLEYTPFGTTWVNQGQDLTKYKFTGKELDKTGFYYFGARYYDPEIGRFVQPDSYIQDPSDPQSFNRYTYCRNNPLVYTDPSGNFWGFIFAALTFISVASAVVSVISSIAAMATGSQTWANIAKISGIISMATGITAAISNSIRAAIASQSTQLASSGPSIELEKIVVTKARIAQQAAEAARQSFVASVVGGITTAVNFITSSIETTSAFLSGYTVSTLSKIAGEGLKAGSKITTTRAEIFTQGTFLGQEAWQRQAITAQPYKILAKGATALTVAMGSAEIMAPYFNPRLTVGQQYALSAIRTFKVEISLLAGAGVGLLAAPLTPVGQVVVGVSSAVTTDAILTQIEKWLENKLRIP